MDRVTVKGTQGVLGQAGHGAYARGSVPSYDPGQDRAAPPVHEERGKTPALLLPMGTRTGNRTVHRIL